MDSEACTGLHTSTGFQQVYHLHNICRVMLHKDQFSSPSPGEEVILSFSPLCHISTQVIDIYYMISVAGTTVFPGSNIFNQQEQFWKIMAEVSSN